MEPGHRPAETLTAVGRTGNSHLPLRTAAASMVLIGIAFIQNPGLLVPDTKFDLAVSPVEFLIRALHLWDTDGAFGQLQNQAYGYMWPMGPFFVLGDVLGLPDWVVQRLWIAVVMVVAFVGAVLLCRALGVRSDVACLVAGFAFALSPRMLSTLGPISIEAWPSALAPWVLLPLVVGSERGSPRTAAMLSGLAVAMVGGVNAVATFAVLPLGVLWLLTRRGGPRRRQLLLWWPVFTLLGTLWWLVPLFLMGTYSPPFLDFIETASVTTFPTTPFDALRGTSAWVPYLDPTWRGGYELLTAGYSALNSGLLLFLGLAGIMRRDHRHRQFLVLAVLVGLLLVTWGHEGSTAGWFSSVLNGQLDGFLAPMRNVHKFDPIIRLPMVIGLALLLDHGVEEFRTRRFNAPTADPSGRFTSAVMRATPVAVVALAVLGLIGSTVPATSAHLTTTRPVFDTPAYWEEAATWLDRNGDRGVALLAPGSSFGNYLWGQPRDEPMQWLADSRWAVRNAIPLTPPGNIRMLDAFETRMTQGLGSSGLASYLRRAGVQYIVVRNDLAPSGDVPHPVLVHQALASSPGIELVESFGPEVGGEPYLERDQGRLLVDGGWQGRWAAIEIFAVQDAATATTASGLPLVVGGPEDLLDLADAGVLDDEPTTLAVDAGKGAPEGPLVLTDGMLDRERFFGRVHDGYSAVRTPGDVRRSGNPVVDYSLGDGGTRWRTTAELRGAHALSASSSMSDANTAGGARPEHLPYAAVDGDGTTSWTSRDSGSGSAPWWQVTLDEARSLSTLDVSVPEQAGRQRIRVRTENGVSRTVEIRAGGAKSITLPDGRTRWLRVEGADSGRPMSLAEVSWPGRDIDRLLVLPEVPQSWGAPDTILIRALQDARTGCAELGDAVRCQERRAVGSEEPFGFDRVVAIPESRSYEARVTVHPRMGVALVAALQQDQLINVVGSSTAVPDARASGIAAFDGNPGTTWTPEATDTRPQLNLNWLGERTLRGIDIRTERGAPARRPGAVRLTWPEGSRTVELKSGRARLQPPIRSDRLSVRVLAAENAVSIDRDGDRGELPVGIGEIRLRGPDFQPLQFSTQERRWDCGTGPTLEVNGSEVRTRLVASPAALYAMQPVPAELCGGAQPIELRAGQNEVSARASDLAAPARLVLGPDPDTPETTPAGASFEGVSREVRPSSDGEYLVIRENTNPGWAADQDGRALPGLVIDGWQQGWVVDGSRDPVLIHFAPDDAYRLGLATGGCLLLLLLLLSVRRVRRRHRTDAPSLTPARLPVAAVLGFGALSSGLMAGWPGLACFVLALAVCSVRSVREHAQLPWLASGLLLVAGGAYFARPWGSADGWAGSWAWPHYLVVTALSVAIVLAADLRPRFFRR